MFLAGQRIAANSLEVMAIYCEVAFVYLLFCTVLTKLQTYCEKRMKTY